MSGDLGLGRLAVAASMLAVAIAMLASPASAGSLFQGCDEAAGTIFMDGDFGELDRFVAGYQAGSKTVRVEGTRESSSGTIHSGITCQSSNWKQFSSKLRDRGDRVRADAFGLSGYGPLPTTMKTILRGGPGADRLAGHDGPDDISGGTGQDLLVGQAGRDTLRAADGYLDNLNCGLGEDRAEVDIADQVIGCENVTVLAGPSR